MIIIILLLFIVLISLLFFKNKKDSFSIMNNYPLVGKGNRGEKGDAGSCGCNGMELDEFLQIITQDNNDLINQLVKDEIEFYSDTDKELIKNYLTHIKNFDIQ